MSLKNTSHELRAHLVIPEGGADGVVICQGGNMAGWSLYVQDGRPAYHDNLYGRVRTTVAGVEALPAGQVQSMLTFDYDGGGLGKGGDIQLSVDGRGGGEWQGRADRALPVLDEW